MKLVKSTIVGCLALFLMCCANPKKHHESSTKTEKKQRLTAQIDSLEREFEKEGMQNSFTVSKLITAYSEFRNNFKEDDKTPTYFLKAGNLARGLEDWKKAADIYKNFFNDFPNHPKREEVLYLLGSIYDLWLNNKKDARQTYEHYLKIYPLGAFSEDVKSSLKFIDVPLKDRVKIFENKAD